MSSKKDTTVRSKGEKIKKKYTARKNKDRYYSTENAFTVLKIGKLLNTIISSQFLELKVLIIFKRETDI